IERLFGDVGGLEQLLIDLCGRVLDGLQLEIPAEVKVTFDTFRSLIGPAPTDPQRVASILAQTLIGLDLPALNAPGVHLSEFLDRIHQAGGDFAPLQPAMETLTAQ